MPTMIDVESKTDSSFLRAVVIALSGKLACQLFF
jgi:hypothetical protein